MTQAIVEGTLNELANPILIATEDMSRKGKMKSNSSFRKPVYLRQESAPQAPSSGSARMGRHSEWPRSVLERTDIGQAGHLPVQCQDCQAVACVVVGDEAVEKAGAAGCFQSLDNGPPVHGCHQTAAQRLR